MSAVFDSTLRLMAWDGKDGKDEQRWQEEDDKGGEAECLASPLIFPPEETSPDQALCWHFPSQHDWSWPGSVLISRGCMVCSEWRQPGRGTSIKILKPCPKSVGPLQQFGSGRRAGWPRLLAPGCAVSRTNNYVY